MGNLPRVWIISKSNVHAVDSLDRAVFRREGKEELFVTGLVKCGSLVGQASGAERGFSMGDATFTLFCGHPVSTT